MLQSSSEHILRLNSRDDPTHFHCPQSTNGNETLPLVNLTAVPVMSSRRTDLHTWGVQGLSVLRSCTAVVMIYGRVAFSRLSPGLWVIIRAVIGARDRLMPGPGEVVSRRRP